MTPLTETSVFVDIFAVYNICCNFEIEIILILEGHCAPHKSAVSSFSLVFNLGVED